MRELYSKALEDDYNTAFWGNVWNSMLTFGQMATMDGWHDHIVEVQSRNGPILILLYMHLVFCGLGIMNVVVGIMVHSAMEVTKDDRQIAACTVAADQQAAVINMRRQLLSQQPTLLGYRTMWHRSECLSTINSLLPHMAAAGITKDEYMKLLMLSEDRYENTVDIDKLMRVALALTGSISERTMDMWVVLSEHRSASERLEALNIGLMDALTHHRFFIREHRFEESPDPGTAIFKKKDADANSVKADHTPPATKSRGMAELLESVDDPVGLTLSGAQSRLDVIFSLFVCVNGMLIGVRTDEDNLNPSKGEAGQRRDEWWKRLDMYFTVAYVGEWMFRWLLVSQEYERDPMLIASFFPRRWLEQPKLSTLKS